jgi:glycosyltransferase involved in cell wall biosynthesis
MLFSTIIPTYNRAHLLPATLDSVLAQKCTDQEVIVVDAGSTDATDAVLAKHADHIRIVRRANCGPGAARNLGIAEARGEYLAFLDSDDLWFPWTLESYRTAINAHGRPSFIAGTHVDFRTPADPLPTTPPPFRAAPYRDYIAAGAAEGVWIGTCAAAVRADVLRAVGGFAEGQENAEDSDLWLRLGVAPGFVRIESPPVFAYRRHEGSAISATDRTFRGSMRLVENERRGVYPGGTARQRERLEILTRHLRPASLACLREGMRAEAWQLFRATLPWNLRLRRAKYVLGFLLTAARGSS